MKLRIAVAPQGASSFTSDPGVEEFGQAWQEVLRAERRVLEAAEAHQAACAVHDFDERTHAELLRATASLLAARATFRAVPTSIERGGRVVRR